MQSVKNLYKISAAIATILLITMCKKPYDPEVSDSELNVLVVEGGIATGNDSTVIRLSRTMRLNNINNNYSTANPEKGATVTIEDDQNKVFALAEGANGKYGTAGLNLPTGRKYRVRIKTTSGEIYLSALTPAKAAPPIDSVGFKLGGTSLQIYVNAHDATNNTRYYRWEFNDTWIFRTLYQSKYKSNDTVIKGRAIPVDVCFGNGHSNNVILATTTKLDQDVVSQQQIAEIASTEERIGIRYSILVKQYALSKEAYEFWANIKRNTETLGSVFDAQPSAPTGNIQCISDNNKKVIGFVSVGSVQTKRIFIDKSQLPANWQVVYPYSCTQDSVFTFNSRTRVAEVKEYLIPARSTLVPLDEMYIGGAFAGYIASSKLCADCTVRGVLAKPPFWK